MAPENFLFEYYFSILQTHSELGTPFGKLSF
jgi:hypothetical protein